MSYTVAIFGEAEKGEFSALNTITSPAQLNDTFGAPPIGSEGITIAMQFLLFKKQVVFIRVNEEGFSLENYFQGLYLLEKKEDLPKITALCLPGVGDHVILEACDAFCNEHNALIISSQKDLFDYLTSRKHHKK